MQKLNGIGLKNGLFFFINERRMVSFTDFSMNLVNTTHVRVKNGVYLHVHGDGTPLCVEDVDVIIKPLFNVENVGDRFYYESDGTFYGSDKELKGTMLYTSKWFGMEAWNTELGEIVSPSVFNEKKLIRIVILRLKHAEEELNQTNALLKRAEEELYQTNAQLQMALGYKEFN